jgi:hypothetical protein
VITASIAMPSAVVAERDHERAEALVAEQAPDEVGALLAVEHGLEQLDVVDRLGAPAAEAALELGRGAQRAAVGVRVARRERAVVEHVQQGAGEVVRDRVAVARDRVA